jgi:hypothetical protein
MTRRFPRNLNRTNLPCFFERIHIFLGVTCYSLQSHLRTTVPNTGQVETDEIYVGMSKGGEQYIIPVQAKGKTEQLGIVQIEQDFAVCEVKFPALICRPVAAQFVEDNLIALFEFERSEGEISIKMKNIIVLFRTICFQMKRLQHIDRNKTTAAFFCGFSCGDTG